MYCFKCGRLIDNDSLFCEFCGARFEGKNGNSRNPYGTNNQFANSPQSNYQVPPVQPQPKYQAPPVQPQQIYQTPPIQPAANEMNEIYHKYMDDQYVAVDSQRNGIISAPQENFQTNSNLSTESDKKGFKVLATLLSIFSFFNVFVSIAEFIVGVIYSSKGMKREGLILRLLAVVTFLLKVVFTLISIFY